LEAVAAVAAAVVQAHVQADWVELAFLRLVGHQGRLAIRLPQVQVVQAARPLISLGPLAAPVVALGRRVRPARRLAVCIPEALAAPAAQQEQLAIRATLAIQGTKAPQ
jgi:hypothetical protein